MLSARIAARQMIPPLAVNHFALLSFLMNHPLARPENLCARLPTVRRALVKIVTRYLAVTPWAHLAGSMCAANSIPEELPKKSGPGHWFKEGYCQARAPRKSRGYKRLLSVSGSASRAKANSHRTLTVFIRRLLRGCVMPGRRHPVEGHAKMKSSQ